MLESGREAKRAVENDFSAFPLSRQEFSSNCARLARHLFSADRVSSQPSVRDLKDLWSKAYSWCIDAIDRVERISADLKPLYTEEAERSAREACQIATDYLPGFPLIVNESKVTLVKALLLQEDSDPVECEDLCHDVIGARLPKGSKGREIKGRAFTYLALLYCQSGLMQDGADKARRAIDMLSTVKNNGTSPLAYELSLAHYCVAKAFLEKRSWHEAEGSLFSALKYCRDPALQANFKGHLFSIYRQQERLDIALKLCQQIVEEMPHCNDFSLSELRGFLLRLGGLSLLTSRFVDARIHLAHALECFAATSGQYSEEALKIRLLMAESLFLGGHVYRAQGVLNQLLLVIDAKSSSSEYQFSYQIRKRLASMKLLAGSALRQTALNLTLSDPLEWPGLPEDLVADKRIMSMVREVAADCSSFKQLRRKLQSLGNRQLNEAFDLYLGLISNHEVEKRADKSELLLFLECAASCLLVLRPGHCMIEQLEEQALSLRLEMQSE